MVSCRSFMAGQPCREQYPMRLLFHACLFMAGLGPGTSVIAKLPELPEAEASRCRPWGMSAQTQAMERIPTGNPSPVPMQKKWRRALVPHISTRSSSSQVAASTARPDSRLSLAPEEIQKWYPFPLWEERSSPSVSSSADTRSPVKTSINLRRPKLITTLHPAETRTAIA